MVGRRQPVQEAPPLDPGGERPESRSGPPTAAGVYRWAAPAALLSALAYGSVQASWALGGAPSFGPIGTDLTILSGWGAVGLCGVAAVVAGGLIAVRRQSRPLLVAAWCVSAALVLNCPILLLDLVGGVLSGLGIPRNLAGFLSRASCFGTAVLLGLAALSYRRRWWGVTPPCLGAAGRSTRTPRWAWWAAYGAVAACGIRVLAQVAVGFGGVDPGASSSLLVFEIGFVLAGVVLPLALVHTWGRRFPRWVPVLAGRRVPRWLVLGPAVAVSGSLVVYFGVGLGQLAVETLTGTADQNAWPVAFLWAAMVAYFLWGIGLGAAALAYARGTRG
jgi:hypothetical protein